jgi:3',5'-cyclic AMP phosphodiesterase CpdA
MIIAQISDTHIAIDTPDADQRASDLARAIADINALDPLPDAIVHTGDIVHSGRPDEYALAASLLGTARPPVYVAAGNKDDRANLRTAFAPRGYLPADGDFICYAIDHFPVRVIVLDTLSATGNRGDFCAERVRRLIELIDAEPAKPIAVFTHHPPFVVPVGPHPLHFEAPEPMSRLQQALQHSGRVLAVFSGHVHRPASGQVGTVRTSVVPCIATTLRKGEYPPSMTSRPIYHLHRVDPDCGFIPETRIVGAAVDGTGIGSASGDPVSVVDREPGRFRDAAYASP